MNGAAVPCRPPKPGGTNAPLTPRDGGRSGLAGFPRGIWSSPSAEAGVHAGAWPPSIITTTHNQKPDHHRRNRAAYPPHVPEKILWTPHKAATMESNLLAWRNAVLGLNGRFHKCDCVWVSFKSVVARVPHRCVRKPFGGTSHRRALMFRDASRTPRMPPAS